MIGIEAIQMLARVTLIALIAVALSAGSASAEPTRPDVVLVSGSPRQPAVHGSHCTSSSGVVSDCTFGPEPRWLSVVRPSETITIRFRTTEQASGTVEVYKRGCEDQPPRRIFKIERPRTTWRVPSFFRGRFELSLSARFTTLDGRAGKTSAALGLFVSETRERGRVHRSLACD